MGSHRRCFAILSLQLWATRRCKRTIIISNLKIKELKCLILLCRGRICYGWRLISQLKVLIKTTEMAETLRTLTTTLLPGPVDLVNAVKMEL